MFQRENENIIIVEFFVTVLQIFQTKIYMFHKTAQISRGFGTEQKIRRHPMIVYI